LILLYRTFVQESRTKLPIIMLFWDVMFGFSTLFYLIYLLE